MRSLHSLSAREQAAVDGVDDGLGADLAATEETAVEALDGVLTALHRRELEVDVALRVGVERDVHHVPVLALALILDVFLEFLDPRFALLPVVGFSTSLTR